MNLYTDRIPKSCIACDLGKASHMGDTDICLCCPDGVRTSTCKEEYAEEGNFTIGYILQCALLHDDIRMPEKIKDNYRSPDCPLLELS